MQTTASLYKPLIWIATHSPCKPLQTIACHVPSKPSRSSASQCTNCSWNASHSQPSIVVPSWGERWPPPALSLWLFLDAYS
eukprot:11017414-Alexandrium_andersonii.AAC.1